MLSTTLRIRLEKAAADNGLDIELPAEGGWLPCQSSHAPLRIWLTADPAGMFVVALSQRAVWEALDRYDAAPADPLPAGAIGARRVATPADLYALLRQALQRARALPTPLLTFAERTAALPRSTEAERLVIQRIGQDVFRSGLLDLWGGRCAIAGLAVPALLRASHIKPWAACERDEERLDVYNGLLLAAHLDAAFDQGLITVEDDGQVVVSPALDAAARALLQLDRPLRVTGLAPAHRRYLAWHRTWSARRR